MSEGRTFGWTFGLAAAIALVLALAPAAPPAGAAGVEKAPRIEVVFVLDTTGSMSGLLGAAQEQIWAIATDLACARPTPELRLGLVAFRDRKDSYVTRVTDLTIDMDALYTELLGLQADGGGDEPESVNQALHEAVTRIDWSADPNAYRVIFLVGDAPPHMEYQDDVDYAESCVLARQRGIAVNTIQCGDNALTTAVWTEIARHAEGVFSRLDSTAETAPVNTPYDKSIALMARQLDETRLPYGTDAERAAAERRRERATAIRERSSLGAQAERGRFNVTAAGHANLYGGKDLLSDVQRGAAKLEDVEEAQLPEQLRALGAVERRAHLEQQARLREDLRVTIEMFAAKRDEYLAGRGAEARSLTARLLSAMQPQAARRGFALNACAPPAR